MNKGIDVLAVMDDQISVIYPNRSSEEDNWHRRVVDARAAIAELIEAVDESIKAQRFDSSVESWVSYSIRFRSRMDQLSKAVDRVRGDT